MWKSMRSRWFFVTSFSVVTNFFFLLNLFYKWQTKVSTTAIYSTIIYFPACPLSPFECYHCWVNFPKTMTCNSPETTQPSQIFIGNNCSTKNVICKMTSWDSEIFHSLHKLSHFSGSSYVIIAVRCGRGPRADPFS